MNNELQPFFSRRGVRHRGTITVIMPASGTMGKVSEVILLWVQRYELYLKQPKFHQFFSISGSHFAIYNG